jgi:hypothetical protein
VLFSFLSYFTPSKTPKKNGTVHPIISKNPLESLKVLQHSILDIHGVLLQNFTLFYRNTSCSIDLLIFLPDYGLYLGEKISWKSSELKGASVERASRKNKKLSTTHFESTEKMVHQKLEDVLSFDSTPIERFFWMECLTEAEFDALDSSFHKLLPKERLLFSDEDIQSIQNKLTMLGTYHDTPYSKLKVIGALIAHTLLLPTATEPFGAFLNDEQQKFLDAPLPQSIVTLEGACASGKSTVLARKIFQILLQDSHAKIVIITPTLYSGEILRQELVSLADFAVIDLDFARIKFLSSKKPYAPINNDELIDNFSHIVCDDSQLLNTAPFLDLKGKTILLSSPVENRTTNSYTLKKIYRSPSQNIIHFSHTKGALYTLLSGLKNHMELLPNAPVMIILPEEKLLHEYKHAIDEYLNLESRILDESFSLQYKSLEFITLSTIELISAINISHCYLINIDPDSPLYTFALSRASESVTIISEELR